MKTVKEKVQMKNFKKYLLALAGGALVVIVLGCGIAGCSSGGNDNGGESVVVTPPVNDDSDLPPDPGEAGKATRGGGLTPIATKYAMIWRSLSTRGIRTMN